MAKIAFTPVTRKARKARIILYGASYAGKSMTAMLLAEFLAAGGKWGVIDTEDKADLHAPLFPAMLVAPLTDYRPEAYEAAIGAAEAAGLTSLVIDQLSDGWIANQRAAQAEKNTKRGWGDVTLSNDDLYRAIRHSSMHLIVTLRARERADSSWSMLARSDLGYEFDLVCLMLKDHQLQVVKSYDRRLQGKTFSRPGHEFCELIASYLAGEDVRPPAPDPLADKKQAFKARVEQEFGSRGFKGGDGVLRLLTMIGQEYDPENENELLALMRKAVNTTQPERN